MSAYLILIPILGALALLLLRPGQARVWALAITIAIEALTLFMLSGFDPRGGLQFGVNLPWMAEAGFHFHLEVDGITMLLLLLTNLLTPLIVYAGFNKTLESESRYYGLILLMQGALNGAFLAWDGLLFYVFYELALIPIYFICAIWGGGDRVRVTLKFFIYTFIGSLFMLVALLYVYLKTPAPHSFQWEDLVAVQLTAGEAWWVALGFFLAFAVKMPVFPFHTWQPDTYTSAPTGGAMLLSAIMLKMGIYGVIRWMIPLAPESMHVWMPVFVGLAVTGVVYASIIAIKQTDIKRMIAYSSIAHVGLIAAGVFAWNKMGVQGGILQMLNHGITVMGLFMAVDILERRLGSRSLYDMGGIAKSAPWFAALFMIILLGSLAVPLTNGFVGEFLLLLGVWQYNPWVGAVAGLTIIFGAVYLLRAFGLSMFGPQTAQTEDFQDVRQAELAVLGVLAIWVLVLGFFPQLILGLTDSSVDRILSAVQF
ncbi:MAG: complex I subunit 4 family protein [Saprospiraceae bacterium]